MPSLRREAQIALLGIALFARGLVDLIFLLLAAALFAATVGLALLCARLMDEKS